MKIEKCMHAYINIYIYTYIHIYIYIQSVFMFGYYCFGEALLKGVVANYRKYKLFIKVCNYGISIVNYSA